MGGDKWWQRFRPVPVPRHRTALSAPASVWPHCRARCRGRGATMGVPLEPGGAALAKKGGGDRTPGWLLLCHLLVWGWGGGRGHSGDLSLDCAATRPQSHPAPTAAPSPKPPCPQSHHLSP